MSTPSHKDKVALKANLLPHAHHIGAPKIEPVDLSAFNSLQAHKVTKSLQKRTEEITKLILQLLVHLFIITGIEIRTASRSRMMRDVLNNIHVVHPVTQFAR